MAKRTHQVPLLTLPTANPPQQVDTVLGWMFFVVGTAAAAWLAALLVEYGMRLGWGQIGVSVVFWLLLAYLLLPRLHQIMTTIYVPNYFIGRARTSDGLLGDPVNVALRGDELQVHEALRRAGWTRADDVGLRTSIRIVTSTLLGRSYDEAPVSPLFLFGRQQDFAYQQEVDGSPGKRHHVRFWRCPTGWMLPGGFPVDWLAAGTYDRRVGFSLFTLQITHKIDANVDTERDHIVRSISATNPDTSTYVIRDFSTGYHSRNGGGDSIITDGDLPIMDVSRISTRMAKTDEQPTDSRDKRPPSITVGASLLIIAILSTITTALALLFEPDQVVISADEASALTDSLVHLIAAGSAAVLLFVATMEGLLAWFVFTGNNIARLITLTLSTFILIIQVFAISSGTLDPYTPGSMFSIASGILILLALSSGPATVYARRTRKASKRVTR